jgi:hypothetical protein
VEKNLLCVTDVICRPLHFCSQKTEQQTNKQMVTKLEEEFLNSCWNGNIEHVRACIKEGVNINIPDDVCY